MSETDAAPPERFRGKSIRQDFDDEATIWRVDRIFNAFIRVVRGHLAPVSSDDTFSLMPIAAQLTEAFFQAEQNAQNAATEEDAARLHQAIGAAIEKGAGETSVIVSEAYRVFRCKECGEEWDNEDACRQHVEMKHGLKAERSPAPVIKIHES